VEVLEDRVVPSATVEFSAAQTFASGGAAPQSVAVGDFNNDGTADLAVANALSHNVGVLLCNGSGGFTSAGTFDTGGSYPFSVAVGDFNSDGNADLAVANIGNVKLSVLLGNGSGGFAPAVTFASGNPPLSLAVGDFNNDGWDDLAVGTNNNATVGVLLANHGGALFAPVHTFATGSMNFETGNNLCYSVAVGDFNNDGKADLAATNSDIDEYGTIVSSVGVLVGDGLGGFAAAVTFPTGGSWPVGVKVADFNNDGQADLVVANNESSNVGVLLGNGAGGFAPAMTFGTGGSYPFSIAVGDFNNDGQADLAVVNQVGSFAVLLGTGLGGFTTPVPFGTGGAPLSVAAADFDNDGRIDLAVANHDNGTVGVLRNTTSQINTVPGPQVVAEDVAKVITGLAVANDSAGTLTVTLAVGHGTLTVNGTLAGGAGISGNGTATVTLTGSQAQINATIGAGLTYLGGHNYSGLDTLTMTTTTTGGLSDTDAVAIDVLSAQQQVDILAAIIADLGDDGVLTGGQENALVKKLGFLSRPNGGAVALQAFVNQVSGMMQAGILTQVQGYELIASAQSIVATMQ
jgi:hypothetical protein